MPTQMFPEANAGLSFRARILKRPIHTASHTIDGLEIPGLQAEM